MSHGQCLIFVVTCAVITCASVCFPALYQTLQHVSCSAYSCVCCFVICFAWMLCCINALFLLNTENSIPLQAWLCCFTASIWMAATMVPLCTLAVQSSKVSNGLPPSGFTQSPSDRKHWAKVLRCACNHHSHACCCTSCIDLNMITSEMPIQRCQFRLAFGPHDMRAAFA